MNYRFEQKKTLVLFGYKDRLTGSPKDRRLQDHNFICSTRPNERWLLDLGLLVSE